MRQGVSLKPRAHHCATSLVCLLWRACLHLLKTGTAGELSYSLSMYIGPGTLNSGPETCSANTLTTALSPSPSSSFLKTECQFLLVRLGVVHMGRSEDTVWESVLSLLRGFWGSSISSLGLLGKHVYLLRFSSWAILVFPSGLRENHTRRRIWPGMVLNFLQYNTTHVHLNT